MLKYTTSPKAREDLTDIWDYTYKIWGERQADKYTESLDKRFEWLAENPQIGKKRDDVKEGYRSYPEGRHVIFYRIAVEATLRINPLREDGIEVIGVPHQSEDIEHHFSK